MNDNLSILNNSNYQTLRISNPDTNFWKYHYKLTVIYNFSDRNYSLGVILVNVNDDMINLLTMALSTQTY